MQEKRSLLNLAIFAVVVIATTVWVLYILNRAEAEIQALSNAPVYLSRRLATDDTDTSQWETYRNEQYGFEVRYPFNFALAFEGADSVTIANRENKNQAVSITIDSKGNFQQLMIWEWAKTQTWPMPGTVEENFEIIELNSVAGALRFKKRNAVIFGRGLNIFHIDDCSNLDCVGIDSDLFLRVIKTFRFIR